MLIRNNCAAGCHRCMCPTNEFLNTTQVWPAKTTEKVKAAVMKAAAERNGKGLGSNDNTEAVVVLGDGVTRTRPGPKAVQYESSIGAAGAHMLLMPFGCVLCFAYFRCTCRILSIRSIMGLSFMFCVEFSASS